MEGTEKVQALLDKLRRNKEGIAPELLKTKYKDAYNRLLEEIKAEAMAIIKPVAARPPGWLEGSPIKQEYAEEIAAAFNRMYEADGYAKKIGQALYKRYSIREALQLAEEINGRYQEAILKIFHQKTCLYTTAENWDPENPVTPRVYNDLVDKFWDEERGEWISEEKPPGNALLLFIAGEQERRKEDRTMQKTHDSPELDKLLGKSVKLTFFDGTTREGILTRDSDGRYCINEGRADNLHFYKSHVTRIGGRP